MLLSQGLNQSTQYYFISLLSPYPYMAHASDWQSNVIITELSGKWYAVTLNHDWRSNLKVVADLFKIGLDHKIYSYHLNLAQIKQKITVGIYANWKISKSWVKAKEKSFVMLFTLFSIILSGPFEMITTFMILPTPSTLLSLEYLHKSFTGD